MGRKSIEIAGPDFHEEEDNRFLKKLKMANLEKSLIEYKEIERAEK